MSSVEYIYYMEELEENGAVEEAMVYGFEKFKHRGCGGQMDENGYCATCGQVLYSADIELK